MKRILTLALSASLLSTAAFAEKLVIECGNQWGSGYAADNQDTHPWLSERQEMPGTESRFEIDGDKAAYFMRKDDVGPWENIMDWRELYGQGYDAVRLLHRDESDGSFLLSFDYEYGLGVMNMLVTGLDTKAPRLVITAIHNSEIPTASIFDAMCEVLDGGAS